MRQVTLSRASLAGFLVASMLPMGLIAALVTSEVTRLATEDAEAHNLIAARATRDTLSAYLAKPRAVLEQIAAADTAGDGPRDGLQRQLDAAVRLHDFIESIVLIDAAGRIRQAALRPELGVPASEFLGLDRSRQALFVRVREERRPTWSDSFRSLVSGRHALALALPTDDGVLLAHIPISWLDELLASPRVPAGATAVIVDRHGASLFHSDPELRDQHPSLRRVRPFAAALAGEEGSWRYRDEGREFLGSTAIVAETGWTVGVLRPQRDAYSGVYRVRWVFAEGLLLALVLAVALALGLARTITRPVARFVQETGAIARGDYEVRIAPQPYRETGALAEGIAAMAGQIRDRERQLRESHERFVLLVDRDAILVHRLDPEGGPGPLLEANAVACGLVGMEREALLAAGLERVVAPGSRERVRALLAGLREYPHCLAELELLDASGREVPIECVLHLHQLDGAPAVMWMARDVSVRKEVERHLAESERQSRFLIESIDAVPFQIDLASRRYTYLGPQAERILGMPAQTWTDFDSWASRIHPEDREEAIAFCRAQTAAGRDHEFRYRMVDAAGRERWIHDVISVSHDERGPRALVGFMRDVTDTRQAEEQLRRNEERLRAVVGMMPVLLRASDEQGRIIFWNRECERVTGYTAEEIVGNPRALELLFPDGEYRAWIGEATSREMGDYFGLELDLQARDGGVRTVSWTDISQKAPIPGWHGWAVGFDVTDRKLVEREMADLERRLAQGQKMEAIGTLAGGIAHDFNNVLGAVLGYAELIEQSAPPGPGELRENVSEVLKATHRARELVRQILTFSRKRELERAPCDLTTLVEETLGLLRASIPRTVRIVTRLEAGSGRVLANATQMQQVLLNLCTNAWHAMHPGGGVLEIEVGGVGPEGAASDMPGGGVRLAVRDTGQGMDEETLSRAFEPFFTTKSVGEGTGLGLAVVHGIVQGHQGTITVQSRPGEGTTVEVHLPRLDSKEKQMAEGKTDECPHGAGRVLYVDDEPALAKLGSRLLASLGYQVASFEAAPEALEAFRRAPDAFDVVVTDQTMPRLTGIELAQQIWTARPAIPVIVCTGYSDVIDSEEASRLGFAALLRKPVARKTLAEALREALEAGRGEPD